MAASSRTSLRLSLLSLFTILCALFAPVAEAGVFKIPPLEESFYQWGESTRSELDPENIKVVVWNILKAKKKKFQRDFAAIGSDTDIFMLQEVNDSDDFFEAYESYPNHQIHFGTSFTYKKRTFWGKRLKSGTAISSSASISDSGMVRSKELEPFVKTPKVVTWAKLPIAYSDTELLAINIHGLNMTKNKDFAAQVEMCGKLIQNHKGPVVFGGDFNTSDLEKYNAMMNVVIENGLVAVPFKNDERRRSKFSKLIIDHTFIRGLQIKNAEVLHKLKSSDHKAMMLELAYKEL